MDERNAKNKAIEHLNLCWGKHKPNVEAALRAFTDLLALEDPVGMAVVGEEFFRNSARDFALEHCEEMATAIVKELKREKGVH